MKLTFYKYQGTGNDFILVDNRHENFNKKDAKLIAALCSRGFGVGADGLILLEDDNSSDFRMVYFNSDGGEGSLCGNGGRCIVAFANFLGIIDTEVIFRAADGLHKARLEDAMVSLWMHDVTEIREKPSYYYLDTGSPHHVQLVKALQDYEVVREGARLRYSLYGIKGSNVNFVEEKGANTFEVRTYERGVENETLSCGTGVTAVALAMHHAGKAHSPVTVVTRGGTLTVAFTHGSKGYTDIVLKGPAEQVFKGEVTW